MLYQTLKFYDDQYNNKYKKYRIKKEVAKMNKSNFFNKTLSFILLFVIIGFCWIGLEYCIDGKVTSQNSDTVFGLMLAYFMNEFLYYKNILK